MTIGECRFPGCDKKREAHGLCVGHYTQKRKGKELAPLRASNRGVPATQRFWMKVQKTDECWVWQSACDPSGYGTFKVGTRTVSSHRFSWEVHFGAIPTGSMIDHTCWRRDCVNPAHLRLIDRSGNSQNQSPGPRKSRTGIRNVYPVGDRWRVIVCVDGQNRHIGYFDSLEAAELAAAEARRELMPYSAW